MKKINNNLKSGISLIVLIVTIIIMIILASAVIMSLINHDIMNQAGNSRALYVASELKTEIERYRNDCVAEGKIDLYTYPILLDSSGTFQSIATKSNEDASFFSSLNTEFVDTIYNLKKNSGGSVSSNKNDASNYSEFYIVNSKLINSTKNFDDDIILFIENGKYTILSQRKDLYKEDEDNTFIIETIHTDKFGVL